MTEPNEKKMSTTERIARAEKWVAVGMGGIERGLDVDPETASPDAIYDDAYNLAFDALLTAGCPKEEARETADYVARLVAQP